MNAPFTNQPGAGLDANGNLLPGYKYMTYSNGVGQGTPMQIGALGAGGQTVTSNAPPAAGTYNPNITAGPQQYANPTTQNMAPQYQGNTMQRFTGNQFFGQQQSPYGTQSQQVSPFSYQNPFQSQQYSQPYGQAFNTQNNPFNRSNQGGLLSGGGYQFGGLLNY